MYIAFNAPNDPRQAPQDFQDLYSLDSIKVPENFLPQYPMKDSIGNPPFLRDEALAPFPRTKFAVKQHRQEYYASISHLDEQIGSILDALASSGEMDHTYISFASDHGIALGHHGLIGKQNLFDHSIRIPLIVVGPDIPQGHQVTADVYLQDIMASSLSLAEIEKPGYVEFSTLLDWARGITQKSHYQEGIYGAYMGYQRMIRKDGYKLIVYPRAGTLLLFDLEEDPLAMNDLSKDPRQQERLISLFRDLTVIQQKKNDPLVLDPEEYL